MERFVILLALAGLSYLLLYTEGLVKTSRARFAVLGVLLAAFGVRFILFGIAPNDTAAAVEDAIAWYRDAGGFWGIRSSALPYPIPVQYFSGALFSCAGRRAYLILNISAFLPKLRWHGRRSGASSASQCARSRVSSLFSLCCSFPPGSFRASAPPQATVFGGFS